MPFNGRCLCGAVAYEITALDGPIVHCHCRSCRKAHASAFATTARVMRENFRWVQGAEKLTAYPSSPGKLRHFCSICGSHLMAERPDQPHVILRVATLDDDPQQTPAMHIWTSHDVPWLATGPGLPHCAEHPTETPPPDHGQALTTLLAGLDPGLWDGDVVFCTISRSEAGRLLALSPLGMFLEAEGITAIIRKSTAEHWKVPFTSVFRGITLQGESSLDAVGLTAAVTGCLARHGIGANVVAGWHHDHIFVPAADAERALEALEALQEEARR